MELNLPAEFQYTLEQKYGSVINFLNLCDSYRKYFHRDEQFVFRVDMRRYTSDGIVPLIIESGTLHDGLIDLYVFIDDERKAFTVCEEYTDEIMRVRDSMLEASEVYSKEEINNLDFLSGKPFMARIEESIITYLLPLDPGVFEKDLSILLKKE